MMHAVQDVCQGMQSITDACIVALPGRATARGSMSPPKEDSSLGSAFTLGAAAALGAALAAELELEVDTAATELSPWNSCACRRARSQGNKGAHQLSAAPTFA